MKLFLTPSAQHLRRSFKVLGFDLGRIETYDFADGEHGYRLRDGVEGKSIGIVGSILPDPKSLFDLMALHHLVRENGAQETILVVPYLGYARQDRPCRPGQGSVGIMVIEVLQKIRPFQFILIDVHSDLIRKTFDPSVRELSALPLFAKTLSRRPPDVIVSPDAGYLSRAKQLAGLLNTHPVVGVIDKVRPRPNVAIAKLLHGDVHGKDVVLVDDIIDTGRTLVQAVKLLLQQGAKTIRLAATHGVFSDEAKKRLLKLPIEEIFITNTLPQTRAPKIRILDVGPLIHHALQPSPLPLIG